MYCYAIDALTNYHIYQFKTTHIYELTFVGQKSHWTQMVHCLGSPRAKTDVTQAVSLSEGSGNKGASTLILVVEAFCSWDWDPHTCCFSIIPRGCLHLFSRCPGVSPPLPTGRWNASQTYNLSNFPSAESLPFSSSSSWRHFSTFQGLILFDRAHLDNWGYSPYFKVHALPQHSTSCYIT